MDANLGRGFVVAVLLASACGGAGKAAGRVGSAGAAGGASGGAGGEPAAAGVTGNGGEGLGSGSAGAAGVGAAGSGAGASGDGPGDGGASWLTPPPVAPALFVPSGATVKLHVQVVGAQLYTCEAAGAADAGAVPGATTYTWVEKDADGALFDRSGARVGTQGVGPSWTSSDGSVANATKVIELSAPVADAIPWRLLRVTSTTGAGLLADVTYVQRLSTVGGGAPTGGCGEDSVGEETRVGYVADDYFYEGGAGSAWLMAPVVPDSISPRVGLQVKRHYHAIGHQIYGCLANPGADAQALPFVWIFKAPDALLYDENFIPAGLHGAGPRWTSSDESSVTAQELGRADAPRAGAIPWLLLDALSTNGTGAFSDVTAVERVNTAGGAAPASGCDATIADTQVRVSYSADYYFLVSTTDGGASID